VYLIPQTGTEINTALELCTIIC